MPFFTRAKDEKIESQYPEVSLPVIESSIPDYLMKDSSPAMVYLLTEQSKQSKFNEWVGPTLCEISRQTRKTNGRLLVVEKWKDKITGTWGILIGTIVFLYTVTHAVAELVYYLK